MLPMLAHDKANHYLYGQGIFALSALACYLPPTGLNLIDLQAISWGLTALFAVGKEVLWDWKRGKGTPSVADVVATLAGAVVPSGTIALAF